MAVTAVEKLAPSRLSDQTELLKDDLDLKSLNLAVAGRASLAILEHVTGATVSRTIDGASTLTVTLRDRERLISKSGYMAKNVDTEIDGLWFRLKAYSKQGDEVTLTFEDREVAVLRDYPKPDAPHNGFLVRAAGLVSRVEFAKLLVAEVTELKIPFVTFGATTPIKSSAATPDQAARSRARGHGFAPAAAVTVKGDAASPEQKHNIDVVLQTGESMGVRQKLLVTAVMVITQESSALTSATNGVHVGLFQQDPRYWPATRDPATDAHAFFEHAKVFDRNFPNAQEYIIAEDVQASGQGKLYEQWRAEAELTVALWGVQGGAGTAGSAVSPVLPVSDSAHQFTRGTKTVQNGKTVFTREDNWSCLQRLASEVNWRCFVVSGSVYFVTDNDLLASQPRMTLSEQTDGVDSIDGSFDEGRKTARKGRAVQKLKQLNQQVTIPCRIGRWQAPPGSSVEIVDSVVFDGRWLVNTISRGLFVPDGTITLHRPQTALPEALAPEYLTVGGATVFAPSITGNAAAASAVRIAIVAAAEKAVELRADFRYVQSRPMPDTLFGQPLPKRIDCSAFFTLCYKEAGADDPNTLGYNGSGNTGTLAASGVWTQRPQPGDAVFYGSDRSFPHHVALYVGGGRCVSMGGAGDPREMNVADMGQPLLGYMSFFDQSPADTHHH